MATTSVHVLLWTFVAGAIAQYDNSNTATSASSATAAAATTSTSTGSSTIHTVTVGSGGSLAFSPNSFTAAVGDQVEFHFTASSPPHSVAEGVFENPCQPSNASAFYSGFVTDASKPFTVTVNSTDPNFFYCSQVGHCAAGMVGVINPAPGRDQADYASAAANAGKASSPAQVQGGVFAAAAQPSSTTTMPGSAAAKTPLVALGGVAGLVAIVAAAA